MKFYHYPKCGTCRKATKWLAEKGYDPAYGARPLKRFMQRELETRLGRAIIAGDIAPGTTVRVAIEDGALSVGTSQLAPT